MLPISHGVPEGCVLGLFLFLLVLINDLDQAKDAIPFAGDTTLAVGPI